MINNFRNTPCTIVLLALWSRAYSLNFLSKPIQFKSSSVLPTSTFCFLISSSIFPLRLSLSFHLNLRWSRIFCLLDCLFFWLLSNVLWSIFAFVCVYFWNEWNNTHIFLNYTLVCLTTNVYVCVYIYYHLLKCMYNSRSIYCVGICGA